MGVEKLWMERCCYCVPLKIGCMVLAVVQTLCFLTELVIMGLSNEKIGFVFLFMLIYYVASLIFIGVFVYGVHWDIDVFIRTYGYVCLFYVVLYIVAASVFTWGIVAEKEVFQKYCTNDKLCYVEDTVHWCIGVTNVYYALVIFSYLKARE